MLGKQAQQAQSLETFEAEEHEELVDKVEDYAEENELIVSNFQFVYDTDYSVFVAMVSFVNYPSDMLGLGAEEDS
jgi:hypothetical protein